jgi:adenylosuccinate lyase
VGAYNATSMLTKDPYELERHCLSLLNLSPSDHSTQMVEPEYLLRLLLEINVAFGIIANMADDFRNLQRSEIDEIREYFSSTQVGSSTMPQKRNPWNCEHVKSLWKAFAPRVLTFYLDQISEHQRDLTNSASGRFVADYLAGFTAAVHRMNKIISGLTVNKEKLLENLVQKAGSSVLAEPAYILLGQQGESDSHEIIRRLTIKAEKEKIPLIDVMKQDKEVWKKLTVRLKSTTGFDAEDFFSTPANYRGKAAEKAQELSSDWKQRMQRLREAGYIGK